MPEPLHIGDVLHGFVDGYFGRDHYDCCRIEAIGADWIVARYISGSEEGEVTTAVDRGMQPGLMLAAWRARDNGRVEWAATCKCGDPGA